VSKKMGTWVGGDGKGLCQGTTWAFTGGEIKKCFSLQVNKVIFEFGISLLQIPSSVPLRPSQLYGLKDIYDETRRTPNPIPRASGDDEIKTTGPTSSSSVIAW
jgi:hypothetical protein